MDVYQFTNGSNGLMDVCSKDAEAVPNGMNCSDDCGLMNGSLNESLGNKVCNDLCHPAETATNSQSGPECNSLHHDVGGSEQSSEEGRSENGCSCSFPTDMTSEPKDCLSVKLKPLSQEATAINKTSSPEVTNDGISSEVEGSPIICDTSRNIDFSYLELTTIPASLYSLPATTELCLDYNDFVELPDALFEQLSCLRTLSLVANNLTSLPESVSSLERLEELRIAQNPLRSLPPSVGNLGQLRLIDFSQNQIAEIPSEFGRLSKLEKLVGFGNQLTCLPQTFGRLENLISIDLSGNGLTVLSHSFGFLVHLRSLNLSSNRLDHLPESVTCLSTLEHLDVSNNMLSSLPDKVWCLQKLKQLYVANNRLRLLPTWIEHLPALEELRLERNQLTGSPLSDTVASNCRRLRVLNLGSNLIRNITNNIVGLENLEWLDLGNAEDENAESTTRSSTSSAGYNWIWQLPPYFDGLKHLRHVNLFGIRLEELPDDFGYLVNLEWLNLGANELRDLPQSFGQLFCLKYLVLSKNQLELLPSDFGNLSKLEELRLDRNRLAELPQSFCRLSRLRHLDLYSNNLTELPHFLQCFAQLKFVNLDENCFKCSSPQLTINGRRITVVKRRITPIQRQCSENDWSKTIEHTSQDCSPVGETGGMRDETHEGNSGTEDQVKGDNASRLGSQGKLARVSREKESEEEEDWDRDVVENSPFVDSEMPSKSSKAGEVAQSCCSGGNCLPFVSFVPSEWHAPRVNDFRLVVRRSPSLPYYPFSHQTTSNNDQFEDADEERD